LCVCKSHFSWEVNNCFHHYLINSTTNINPHEQIIAPGQNPLKCGNVDGRTWPRKYPAALEINRAEDSALSRKLSASITRPGARRDMRNPASISRDCNSREVANPGTLLLCPAILSLFLQLRNMTSAVTSRLTSFPQRKARKSELVHKKHVLLKSLKSQYIKTRKITCLCLIE